LASVRLWIILFRLKTTNKLSGAIAGDSYAGLVSSILIHLLYYKIKIKISSSRVGMVCTPIYYFSASKGKYLELATSSHPIEASTSPGRELLILMPQKSQLSQQESYFNSLHQR
jgi:hypothetical protein